MHQSRALLFWTLLALALVAVACAPGTPTPPAAVLIATAAPTASPTSHPTPMVSATPASAAVAVSNAASGTPAMAATAASTGQATYSDPFAYCAAVGTIDAPDARFTGPKVPPAVAAGLQKALNLPGTPAPPVAQNSFWRCLDGKVYACTVGANLPCMEKADTSRTPNEGMTSLCQQQPNADLIPAFAAGRSTVWEWRCTSGKPEIVKQIVTQIDSRGFQSNIWYELQSPGQ